MMLITAIGKLAKLLEATYRQPAVSLPAIYSFIQT
jgi:hypothetical protein